MNAIPDPADTLSGTLTNLPAIPDEWDAPTLASLRDPGVPHADLRLEHYTEQVVAALHGDPRVFGLAPDAQEAIGNVARVFELIARGILAGHDPKVVTRRAAVLLMCDPTMGTPMRCPACSRIHYPLTGDVDWEVAGREDIMCGPCWKAQPKHAVKAAPGKAPRAAAKTAAAGTRRRRPSQARKTVTGGKP
jgi:hypothetical protein